MYVFPGMELGEPAINFARRSFSFLRQGHFNTKNIKIGKFKNINTLLCHCGYHDHCIYGAIKHNDREIRKVLSAWIRKLTS